METVAAEGLLPSILKSALDKPEKFLPGFGVEVRFLSRSPQSDLPKGSRLVLEGSGGVTLSIPPSAESPILPGVYSGRIPSSEAVGWLGLLAESGIENHSEPLDEGGSMTLSILTGVHAFHFHLKATEEAFRKIRPAIESMAAQALKSPQWTLSLAVRALPRPGKSGTELSLAFSNTGNGGVWIDAPGRPPVLEDAPVCEMEIARKPLVVPVGTFERLKRSHAAIRPVEGTPLLWIAPQSTVTAIVQSDFQAREITLARIIYRSSGEGHFSGVPRFIGTLMSPVFELQA